MVKIYDGMEAVVDRDGEDALGIATKVQTMNPKTWGFGYEQLGVYFGDDSKNFKRGAIIKIWFRPPYKGWKNIVKSWFRNEGNIIKIELVKQGEIESEWQSIKKFFMKRCNGDL